MGAGKGDGKRAYDRKKWEEAAYWKRLEERKKKEKKRGNRR